MAVRNVVSESCMVDGYCKLGRIGDARNLFDVMLERTVVTWTAMIEGEGIVEVNSITMSIMFDACGGFGRCGEGIQMHGLVSRMGFDYDVFLGNSIIIMYCRFGFVDEATKIIRMMSKTNIVSWNSLIAGYVQCGISSWNIVFQEDQEDREEERERERERERTVVVVWKRGERERGEKTQEEKQGCFRKCKKSYKKYY
ncbi:putative pentatricopeptide [Rosa chinensis]|uniref:Putative pentatricopeptide n=1 Tax=Rosa chinensis TaxID=74649 RepID=A0A2P6P6W9_ROSCH|nr:putative pentatricopeptide [Rosa chinensis]